MNDERLYVPALELSQWGNDLHMRFHTDQQTIVDRTFDPETPAPVKLQPRLEAWEAAVAAEDDAYKYATKAPQTQLIAEADQRRDSYVNQLNAMIETMAKMVSIPTMQQAALAMQPTWTLYKPNPHLAYEAESNAIDQWYQAYSADAAQVSAAATLGLTDIITAMMQENQTVTDLIIERNAQQAAQEQQTALKDARKATDQAYKLMIRRLNACAELSDDPHEFDALILSLTSQQDYFRNLYEERKRNNRRVKIASTIVGNHTYAVSNGWTWATLATKNPKALALDPTPSAPGEEPVVTPVRIISVDPKAKKAGGLAVALNGVIVRPSDDVDVEKEYELVALPEE